MKPALALLAVLLWSVPGFAESRSVLIVVTHDPVLGQRAHRRLHMEDGRITSDERR